MGNRTCDLPARSAVPQPTAPPRAPRTTFTLTFIIHCTRNIQSLEFLLLDGCDKAAPLSWQDVSDRAIMQTGF